MPREDVSRNKALFGVFLCFALCWQLVLSSISFGLQRDSHGSLVMVLCSGGNMVTYSVGSDSQPIGDTDNTIQSEFCPFALASVADVPITSPFSTSTISTAINLETSWRALQPNTNLQRVKRQRAPPEAEQIT